ncbi:PREDICTED: pH-response transcription factor pacC/RIM101-like [Nicotiana attenuata]|uniref:pH-response transcription factor pacC/RIM101-like n=1 Tax=Nicotiana attenuata TaxID=49451 RepID=UPI000904D52D|nr:PREDICTED: pH-response transcription factor pacC/RIM101-like [Nicotiana attenuata]
MSPPLPRHPLSHPPQSTSLTSTMFIIPPLFSNSAQYYSMPTKESQSNIVFNFIPTPSIPSSLSGFHGSQHGGSPAAAPLNFHGSQHSGSLAAAPPSFHGSPHGGSPAAAPPSFHGSQHGGSPIAASPSFHGIQHDGSSFVDPSSSTPSSLSTFSISRLDIGGSRPVASSGTSRPSSRCRQNLGGDVQYDSYNRLIIVPYEDGSENFVGSPNGSQFVGTNYSGEAMSGGGSEAKSQLTQTQTSNTSSDNEGIQKFQNQNRAREQEDEEEEEEEEHRLTEIAEHALG